MHRHWRLILRPLLEATCPAVIVEVGAQCGPNTWNLLEVARACGATVHSIDPEPQYDAKALREEHGDRFVCHRALSLNVLGRIERPDIVLIDGDHNWYTVLNELRLLERSSEKSCSPFPVVALHDTGWPYGQRDTYYDPETVPNAHRQPYKRAGVVPGSPELAPEGGLNPKLCNGIYENALHNGVLTAVEDFVAESKEAFELRQLPGGHGLTVLVPGRRLDENMALSELLSTMSTVGFLQEHAEWLERTRVEQLIESQQSLSNAQDGLLRTQADLEAQDARVAELCGVVKEARGELVRHERAAHELRDALKEARDELVQREQTAHELRDALKEARSELVQRGERIATLAERRTHADDRADVLSEQLEGLKARLDAAMEEHKSTVAELSARHAERVRELQDGLEYSQAKAKARDDRLSSLLEARTLADTCHESLLGQFDELEGRLRAAETERESMATELDTRLEDEVRWQEELFRRVRADLVDRHRALLQSQEELARIIEIVERVAGSRSWRLGHGIMVLGRRLTFRRPRGQDALVLLGRRAERALATIASEADRATVREAALPELLAPADGRHAMTGGGSARAEAHVIATRVASNGAAGGQGPSEGASPRPRVVVYTAVAGGYDVVKPPSVVDGGGDDFVCFTDRPTDVPAPWQPRPFDFYHVDPARMSRYAKLHPHLYFPDHEWSIWVDANLLIHEGLSQLVNVVATQGTIGMYLHPHRSDCYAEADEVIRRGGLDDPEIVREQIDRYRRAGFEGGVLFETGVTVRRHHDEGVQGLMRAWWREIQNGSRRDQISLPFVAEERRVPVVPLGPRGESVRTSPILTRYSHGPSPVPA